MKYILFKQTTLLLISYLFTVNCIGQELRWANQMGGSGDDRVWKLNLDNNNRVIAIGEFSNTVDFDPGVNVNSQSSNGNLDIFVTASDTAGNFLWVKTFGGTGNDRGRAITTDIFGNTYITGSYSGTVDFDPSSSVTNLVSKGGEDIFVCKLDISGNLVWAKSFGGTGNDLGLTVEVSSSGDIFLGGSYRNTVDFDPGRGITNRTSSGGEDSFIIKFDNIGTFQWVNAFGGSSSTFFERTYEIRIDNNNDILALGAFSGTADFDPSSSTQNVSSRGEEDSYLCKMSTSGSLLWVKTWGGTEEDLPVSFKIGKSGDFYIGGTYRGTTDLDPSSAASNFGSSGSRDIFLSKLDSAGNYVWGRVIRSVSAEIVSSLDLDENDNIYATGYYFITTDFDPGAGAFNLSGGGGINGDSYLLQLDKDGNFVWAFPINSPLTDNGGDVKSDKNGNIYLAGLFSSTFDFDPQTGVSNLTSNGSYDGFIQKVFECKSSDSSFFEIACRSYTSPSGKYRWTTNGVYNDTLKNHKGCDSIITITLFVTNPVTSVVASDPNLMSTASNSTYQWLDCGNGYAILAGETNASFTASSNGRYAVEITENGCKDTSACYQILTVGLHQNQYSEQLISVVPNPNNGVFNITFSYPIVGKVKLLDQTGKVVLERNTVNSKSISINSELNAGLYFIEITNQEGIRTTSKIIIQ